MKLLIVVNNHNSFSILDLCIQLRKYDPTISYETVCSPEFFQVNCDRFERRSIRPILLGPKTGLAADAEFKYETSLTAVIWRIFHRVKNCRNGSVRSQLVKFMFNILLQTSVYSILREFRIYKRLKNSQQIGVALIKKLSPDIVMSLSDRTHDYIEGSMLWAAKSSGIPVVLPYVAQFDIDAAIEYRKRPDGTPFPELNSRSSFSLYKLYSRTRLKNHVYRDIFFQEPFILNAAKRADVLSSYSWWVGNGISDIVCVDSEYTYGKYVANKVPEKKIRIVGHVNLDSVYQSFCNRSQIRERLQKKYSLNPNKSLLVLSVPQYAEQGFMSSSEHWKEVNSIIQNITNADKNLLLSVHPRCNVDEYKFLEELYNCRILSESLADVIGASDLFLASNSTTFIWSILCGIPTIGIYSPVPFLYENFSSIIQVGDSKMLPIVIGQALSQTSFDYTPDWKKLSREIVFDGKYIERFAQILKSTI